MPERASLEQIEGDHWGPAPADATDLIRTVHQLRRKPLIELTIEDLRIMIGQSVGAPVLTPRALDALEAAPLAEGDFFPGDLLVAVLRQPDLDQSAVRRLRGIVERIDPTGPDYPAETDLPELIERLQSR